MKILNLNLLIIIFLIVNNYDAKAQNVSPYLNNKNFDEQQNIKFEISNIANSTLSNSHQKNIYETALIADGSSKNFINNSSNIGFDNQIYAKSAIKLNNQNYLGATAKIEFNYNSSGHNQQPNLDQFFIYYENDFGKLEFGNYLAINKKMKYGPARFARGAGGINGKYLEYINLPIINTNNSENSNNFSQPHFIMLAQSPIGHGGYAKGYQSIDSNYYSKTKNSYFNKNNFRALKDDSFEGLEDALKINYYSPKINNIQFGVSYAPNSSNQGLTAKTALDTKFNKLQDLWSFGINYSNDFDNLNLALSSTAETAKSVNNSPLIRNDLIAYDLGGSLSYFGFTIGASYGNWGKSLLSKNQNPQNYRDSFYYSTGIAYQIGPIKSSITSLNSNFQNNKYQALSFGVDYKIKKNLITYLEFTKFKFSSRFVNFFDATSQIKVANSQFTIQNNRGNVLLTGIYYYF